MQRYTHNLSRVFIIYVWIALLALGGAWAPVPVLAEPSSIHEERVNTRPFVGEWFGRTELYFGSLKPDQTHVTQEEFDAFLDEVITPRFPEGLTLLTGLGQFQNADGEIIQENARVLILLYPINARRSKSEKIETIRKRYKKRFQQESVLRVDRCCERVGF